MKLEPTQNSTLYEFYDPLNWPPPWRVRIERMLALVIYLESKINYPSILVTHSHENLNLSIPGHNWVLSVRPTTVEDAPKGMIYEISCGLDDPWFSANAFVASLEDAGRVIRAVINGEVQLRFK